MDVTQVMLRIVGIFYLLSGLAGMRAMAVDSLLDKVLAGITLKPTERKEVVRRWFLVSGSATVGLSGAALMVLSLWAVPLFVVATLLQAAWLIWARTNYVPESDDEVRGRRQSTNAAIIYAAMTAMVVWVGAAGMLMPWLDPWALFIPVAGLLLAYLVRHLFWKPGKGKWDDDTDDPPFEAAPLAPLYRIHIEPKWGGYPLEDADTNLGIAYGDYLDDPLADRIYEWTCAFHGDDDYETQAFWARFDSPEAEAAHRAEGRAIVAELETIFGPGNITGPVYPADIRYGPDPELVET
jgi:hypothetical protein